MKYVPNLKTRQEKKVSLSKKDLI